MYILFILSRVLRLQALDVRVDISLRGAIRTIHHLKHMNVTFFRGHPSNDLLPREEILRAATSVLTTQKPSDDDEETRHPLTYGSDPGALAVRATISEWTNRTLSNSAAPCTAECINLTNGASFGAATALLQCCPRDYTRMAFAISPTYFLMNQIFVDAGFEGRMRAVVETERGIDLVGLEAALKKDIAEHAFSKQKLQFRYVFYLVPIFSNPGGYCCTAEESVKLVKLARKYDVLLLCDHVYDHLDFKEAGQIPSLVAYDRETLPSGHSGNVVANCSFSKYLGPGLRVGWQECASPELAYHLSQSGANKSGGTPAHLNTFIAEELIKSGAINRILASLNSVYGSRATEYMDAMRKYLPQGTKIAGGKGGYFFWVTFPHGYDVQGITAECAEHGIRLAPGQHFEVLGDSRDWGQHCFRVSLSYHKTSEAIAAIKVWGKISRNHCKQAA